MYGLKMIPFTDKYAEPETRLGYINAQKFIAFPMFLRTQIGWFIVSIFVYINDKKQNKKTFVSTQANNTKSKSG